MTNILFKYQELFHPVVDFEPGKDKLYPFDFTASNNEIDPVIVSDTNLFSKHVADKLSAAHARYGIGGYDEHRTVYSRSAVFDGNGEEPRRLHLGTDIWGPAGTPVYVPLGGMVHSFGYNGAFGDYGATLILLHQLDGLPFYTLYGHISMEDINHLSQGQYMTRGETIAHFGEPHENGSWPPHLHFQLILDMGLNSGDYPGVCKFTEKDKWLENSPDPDIILQMNRYI